MLQNNHIKAKKQEEIDKSNQLPRKNQRSLESEMFLFLRTQKIDPADLLCFLAKITNFVSVK